MSRNKICPNLKVEMRLLNARHVASARGGVGDLIFSEPTLHCRARTAAWECGDKRIAEYATDQRAYDCGKIRDAADKDSGRHGKRNPATWARSGNSTPGLDCLGPYSNQVLFSWIAQNLP